MFFALLFQKPIIKLPPPPPPDQIMTNINNTYTQLEKLINEMKKIVDEEDYNSLVHFLSEIKKNKNVLNYTDSKPIVTVCTLLKESLQETKKELVKLSKKYKSHVFLSYSLELIKELTKIDAGVDDLFRQKF